MNSQSHRDKLNAIRLGHTILWNCISSHQTKLLQNTHRIKAINLLENWVTVNQF